MDLNSSLNPVLDIAGQHASAVDTDARFPEETVAALRESGLLGLTLPEEVGGMGAGPHELIEVVGSLAGVCGSSAMIYLMHIAAAMPTAAAPPPALPDLVTELASGRVLGSLAFSEAGSRSHFWAPVSQAESADGVVRLNAKKSWVTSAGHADVYLASTQTPGAPTVDLYAVPADTTGLEITGGWSGMGYRGNASNPMHFGGEVSEGNRLGASGGGLDIMLGTVLPWFNLGNASVSLGLSRAAVNAAVRHCSGAKLQHLGQSLAALPTIRAQLAKMSIDLAATASYLAATADRLITPREDTTLFVLGAKAAANDAALRITDTAMRVCGGAAFSRHLAIERFFRDARAGAVMAPTADVLYDFYGRAICGMPLFDEPEPETGSDSVADSAAEGAAA